MIILRRKTPRHDGTRYYAKPAPVQRHVEHARKFATATEAEAERATLREPRLWEAMDEADAAAIDAPEREQQRKQAECTLRTRHALRVYAAIAAASAHGLALPPEMRR